MHFFFHITRSMNFCSMLRYNHFIFIDNLIFITQLCPIDLWSAAKCCFFVFRPISLKTIFDLSEMNNFYRFLTPEKINKRLKRYLNAI